MLGQALHQALRPLDEEQGVLSFCSTPVWVNGYRVSTVLQLRRPVFQTYYALKKRRVGGRSIHTSLLDATVTEYLAECIESLSMAQPGVGRIFDRESDEIIRTAGKWLMCSNTRPFQDQNPQGLVVGLEKKVGS